MSRAMHLSSIVVSILLLLCACGAPAETAAPQVASLESDFDRTTLTVTNKDGSEHRFSVYVATRFEQQRRGLMFVRKMPADVGMLFIYDTDGVRSMWMKNTYISLDLVFARADGTVSSIIHDTTPLSLESRSSVEAVRYVLELNAGTARRLEISNNSTLSWDAVDID